MQAADTPNFSIRTYRASDAAACLTLYFEGLIGGKNSANDTYHDIDNIEAEYIKSPSSHFWVAVAGDETVVGMIGVQQHDAGVGEIRRLRVAVPYRRRGIGSALVETALRFCEEHQYLKVKLDTYWDYEAAIQLFKKFHFRHERTKTIGEKQLLYFYLDLYSTEKTPLH
ncbi:MAG TPA: GNAT family N-acetyltransferase [Tepidisphaeraceae bacterium]|jgi:ribosomal protein S18 acetylase RimI-like enzyme|nr:GNAT family N-acetyltransferase [Tepidisphaeraceae bacterium]